MNGDANRCANCTLPINFPGISFNENGICNLCDDFNLDDHRASQNAAKTQLYETIQYSKNISTAVGAPYDAIVALSGGKDSCFTLKYLVQEHGLRCFAITVDNGFLSDQSVKNSRQLCESLGVDFVLWKPNTKFMNSLYVSSLDSINRNRGAIVRASDLCNNCINLINSLMLKEAVIRNVPMIAGGYIAGQVPRGTCVMKLKLETLLKFSAIKNSTGNSMFSLRHYQITETDLENYTAGDAVHILNPMLSLNYNEEDIIASLEKFEWKRSPDTGSHSSNCRINDLGIKVHLKKYGFHPYEQEIAEQVRSGNLTREKALKKIMANLDEERIAAVESQVRMYE